MKIRMELILGVVLFSAAFAGLYLAANVINPPDVKVLIALEDLAAGEVLEPGSARLEEVSIPDPSLVITEKDLSQFSGATTVEDIHQGEMLQKASFVVLDNPASVHHTSLGMVDPAMAAFVVPVSMTTAPPGIVRGDLVDLVLGIGGENQMMGQRLIEEQQSGEMEPSFPGQQSSPQSSGDLLEPQSGDGPSGDESGQSEEFPHSPGESVSARAEMEGSEDDVELGPEEVLLPISKLLVQCVRVLEVVYEEIPGSSYSAAGDDEPQRGEIVALVLEVPFEAQELLTFALVNGEIRVGLRSPLAQAGRGPTMGMSWNDLASFFALERSAGVALWTEGDEILGPGASLFESRIGTLQGQPGVQSGADSSALEGSGSD